MTGTFSEGDHPRGEGKRFVETTKSDPGTVLTDGPDELNDWDRVTAEIRQAADQLPEVSDGTIQVTSEPSWADNIGGNDPCLNLEAAIPGAKVKVLSQVMLSEIEKGLGGYSGSIDFDDPDRTAGYATQMAAVRNQLLANQSAYIAAYGTDPAPEAVMPAFLGTEPVTEWAPDLTDHQLTNLVHNVAQTIPGMHSDMFLGYTADDGGNIRIMTNVTEKAQAKSVVTLLAVSIPVAKLRDEHITDAASAAARWQLLVGAASARLVADQSRIEMAMGQTV